MGRWNLVAHRPSSAQLMMCYGTQVGAGDRQHNRGLDLLGCIQATVCLTGGEQGHGDDCRACVSDIHWLHKYATRSMRLGLLLVVLCDAWAR
jgi:hypothetical protein